MKRLVYIIVLLALLLPLTSVVDAQETQEASSSAEEAVFDYQKAYEDYNHAKIVYDKAHSDYKLSRSQYMQAQTLAAQTKARDATVAMLQARDDVMTTYLTALRMRLKETEGITEVEKEGLYSRIDSEIFWYANHKATIPSAGTLSDLVKDSNEAKTHYELTDPLIYEVLSTIPGGRVEVQYDLASEILNSLKSKVSEIRAEREKDTSNIERGLIDTEQKLTRSLDKQVDAQRQIAEIINTKSYGSRRSDYKGLYSNIVDTFRESHQFIRDASKFMMEIVRQIKIAD